MSYCLHRNLDILIESKNKNMEPNNLNINPNPMTPPAQNPPPVINMTQNQNTPVHRSNLKPATSILIVIILVILGIWGYKYANKSPAITLQTTADQGMLVEGFPARLMIFKDSKIESSKQYITKGSSGDLDTFVTRYSTSSSFDNAYTTYLNHLTENGYSITRSSAPTETAGRIFAARVIGGQTETVVINIMDNRNNSRTIDISVSRTR
jgi:hypothetical protein